MISRFVERFEFFRSIPDGELPHVRLSLQRGTQGLSGVGLLLGPTQIIMGSLGGTPSKLLVFLLAFGFFLAALGILVSTLGRRGQRHLEARLFVLGIVIIANISVAGVVSLDRMNGSLPTTMLVPLILAAFVPWRPINSLGLGAASAVLPLIAVYGLNCVTPIPVSAIMFGSLAIGVCGAVATQVNRRVHLQLETARGALVREMEERSRIELELRQAGKLEAVGRLASGIAHEINTPIQFVGDSVRFIEEASYDILALLERNRTLRTAVEQGSDARSLVAELRQAEEDADIPYLAENLPLALKRTADGLERVATLVRSMKEFAHPDQKEMAEADVNRGLKTTLIIARNEYKYVADIETDFGDLPPVVCQIGELNQAFLNILVNASHAIAEVSNGTAGRGRITVKTEKQGDSVLISISDTGAGIPESARRRMFEPFFTTKEVGKGTGQGLFIARNVIVDKHGGKLTFETKVGEGTTFFIRLPIVGETARTAGVAA